jgi:cytoskeletal protein RodZ
VQIAVPVAIVVFWVASLSAQVGVVWPNYQSEQKEKSEQTGKSASEEKSEKGKSTQGEKNSSESKARRADQSSPAAASKEKRRQHQD